MYPIMITQRFKLICYIRRSNSLYLRAHFGQYLQEKPAFCGRDVCLLLDFEIFGLRPGQRS